MFFLSSSRLSCVRRETQTAIQHVEGHQPENWLRLSGISCSWRMEGEALQAHRGSTLRCLRFLRRCPRSVHSGLRIVGGQLTAVPGEQAYMDAATATGDVLDFGSLHQKPSCNHMHVYFFAVARFRPALSHNSDPKRFVTPSQRQ